MAFGNRNYKFKSIPFFQDKIQNESLKKQIIEHLKRKSKMHHIIFDYWDPAYDNTHDKSFLDKSIYVSRRKFWGGVFKKNIG